MISTLRRALQPSVTDLKAEFKLPAGCEILQAPVKLPPIFNGDKAVIYGIVCSEGNTSQESVIKGTAILRGMTLGNTIEYSIPFQIPKPSQEELGPLTMPIVHHLAAKSLLKDWEAGEGVKQLKVPAKEAIIKLSIDSSVVSAHTAYVAVDEDQDKPIEGAIQIWDVTTMMARQEMGGCTHRRKRRRVRGSSFVLQRQCAPLPSKVAALGLPQGNIGPYYGSMPPMVPGGSSPLISRYAASLSQHIALPVLSQEFDCGITEYCSERGHESSCTETHSDKLSALVSLQQAEGWWKLDATLSGVLSKSLPELEVACPVGCQGDVRRVWATVLALAYLEACLTGQRQEWELVARKAEFWLGGQSLPAGSTLHILKEAAKYCL